MTLGFGYLEPMTTTTWCVSREEDMIPCCLQAARRREAREYDSKPHPCIANCSVNYPTANALTGCRDGYTTDDVRNIHCNEHPIPVLIVL
jgi:hypothetical protein